MTTNHNPMLAIATMFAKLSGQDQSQKPQELISRQAEAESTSYIPDHLMARARVSAVIELEDGEVIEITKGKSALAFDHVAVIEFPTWFTIEQEPEPEPARIESHAIESDPPPAIESCWSQSNRVRRASLGLRPGVRRRRDI